MHCATRSLLATVSAAACLVLVARSAQAQLTTPEEPLLTVDQVRDAFTARGYQVNQVKTWDWTSPPATSLQIQDLASGRALMVLVYSSATPAQAARLQFRREFTNRRWPAIQ